MLIEAGLFRYHGLGNSRSFCNLEIYIKPDIQIGPKALVLIIDNPNNPGTSVTNASEIIASVVYQKYLQPKGITPSDIYWAEQCGNPEHNHPKDEWDAITYDWQGIIPVKPHWKSVDGKYISGLKTSFMEEENDAEVSCKADKQVSG
jgi:hypothetical protein